MKAWASCSPSRSSQNLRNYGTWRGVIKHKGVKPQTSLPVLRSSLINWETTVSPGQKWGLTGSSESPVKCPAKGHALFRLGGQLCTRSPSLLIVPFSLLHSPLPVLSAFPPPSAGYRPWSAPPTYRSYRRAGGESC